MNATLRSMVLVTSMIVYFIWIPNVIAQDVQKTSESADVARLRELANPGPEHQQLATFGGKWKVRLTMGDGDRSVISNGNANSYMTLEDRFLWIGYNTLRNGRRRKGTFTIGFDRRNDLYTLIAMDTDGTYFVTSRGKVDKESGKVKLYGKDDDPHMKSLGFDKEFAHEIDLRKPDEFEIAVYFIDTRTSDRAEHRAMNFTFTRTK